MVFSTISPVKPPLSWASLKTWMESELDSVGSSGETSQSEGISEKVRDSLLLLLQLQEDTDGGMGAGS